MGRRNKNIAKYEICGVFRELIQNGNHNPTVSGIIEIAGLNRKTFYNHFSCKDELVAWIFRHDIAEILSSSASDVELILPPVDPYDFNDLPCYYRNPSSTFSLDQTSYFESLRQTFIDHEDYYRVLLKSEMKDAFCTYLITLFQGLFKDDLEYFLHGRKMPESAKEFISRFFAEGVVHYFIDSIPSHLASKEGIYSIAPVNNLIHESMYHLVDAYQAEKSANYFNKMRNI